MSVYLQFDKSQLDQILKSLTISCERAEFALQVKKNFLNKLQQAGVIVSYNGEIVNTKEIDQMILMDKIDVELIQQKVKYSIVQCDGSYYIVGGDSIPILCKTKEIAQKEYELLNQD